MLSYLQTKLDRVEWKNAIKTGVAAALSIIAGNQLDHLIGHPSNMITILWCTLTAIVVLQARLGGTYKESVKQLMGIAVGSAIGCISAALSPTPPTPEVIGISVTATVILCSLMNIKDSIRIAALSTAIVLIIWSLHTDISPWKFGFYRFLNSTTGVIVSVLVAHLLWPTSATTRIRSDIADILISLKNLLLFLGDLSIQRQERKQKADEFTQTFLSKMEKERSFLDEARVEISTKVPIHTYELLLHRLQNLFETIIILKKLDESLLKAMYNASLESATQDLFKQMLVMFDQLVAYLQKGHLIEEPPPLARALELVYEERVHIRRNQTLRNFPLENVEIFFVYFHTLRMVAEQLMRIHASIKESISRH